MADEQHNSHREGRTTLPNSSCVAQRQEPLILSTSHPLVEEGQRLVDVELDLAQVLDHHLLVLHVEQLRPQRGEALVHTR